MQCSVVYCSVCICICMYLYCSCSCSFRSSQRQKRCNSARSPQCLNLTTSKTKDFCEASSIFRVDNIKNETILRDFLQYWKVEFKAHGLVPLPFVIVPLHLSKALRLPRKSDARSYEVLHPSCKVLFPKLKI